MSNPASSTVAAAAGGVATPAEGSVVDALAGAAGGEAVDALEANSEHESEVENASLVDQNAADREDGGADGVRGADAAVPSANPPAPPANPPAGGHRRRAALPIVDLDNLKQERANLKRQLRQCTKNVKAQAGMSPCNLMSLNRLSCE